MADPLALPRVRGNVEKMINAGAPPHDIDDYLASEGYTKETFRAAVKTPPVVGQGGAPSLPADSTKTPGKWSPDAIMRERFAFEGAMPGVDWLRTRATNAIANAASFGDTINPVAPVRNALRTVVPETMNALDSGNLVRRFVHKEAGAPVVNAPGKGGQVIDAATEAAIGSLIFPGVGMRNVFPAMTGGALSEFSGQQAAGTPYEIPARVIGGVVGGVVGAGVQEAGRAAVRGTRNALGAGNVQEKATGIVGRAATRDKLTPKELMDRTKALGDDAIPADAGGENVRGALRGSIAAPGEARTTVRNALQDRAEGEHERVLSSINRNVSPKGLTQTVDDLVARRSTAPQPLYEKAFNVGQVWSPRVQQFVDDPLFKPALAKGIEIQRIEALAKGQPFDPKAYGITGFAADGSPIMAGTPNMRSLNAAKKGIDALLESYRDKTTGRLVLDERGRAIDMARAAFVKELDNLNPDYAAARRAYAEPSQLKDAAEKGARLFASSEKPDVVRREFLKLTTADEKDAFRIGVAEHLRGIVGRRDASNVAARVVPGGDARKRLIAVLGEKEAKAILSDLSREKTYTGTMRDVGVGSRTTPMKMEADDNAAMAADVLTDTLRGRFTNALARVGGRIGEGRTEKVNARVAEILTSMKPEDRAAFVKALEDSLLQQRLASPRNAFRAGMAAPLPAALGGDRK